MQLKKKETVNPENAFVDIILSNACIKKIFVNRFK